MYCCSLKSSFFFFYNRYEYFEKHNYSLEHNLNGFEGFDRNNAMSSHCNTHWLLVSENTLSLTDTRQHNNILNNIIILSSS